MTRARWVTRTNEHNRDDFESATYTFNALRWGAAGNGVTDDTAAIQAMLTAGRGLGGTYFFPAGAYLISDTLTITDQAGIHFTGSAGQFASNNINNAWVGGTMFNWNTNDKTKPFLRVSDTNGAVFENFFFKCNASLRCLAGIELYNAVAGSNVTAAQNIFRNVHLSGNTDGLEVGFLIPSTTQQPLATDGNNDFNTFESCTAYNVRVAGALINHSQSLANEFRNCQFRGSSTSLRAQCVVGAGYWYDADTLTHYYGTGNAGTAGSFHWYGGGASWIDNAAFVLGGSGGDTYLISGANIESVNRILYTPGPSGGTTPQITIQGSRFESSSPSIWNADGRIISMGIPGPLRFVGNRVSDGAAEALTIYFNSDTNQQRGALTLEGNYFETTNKTVATLVEGTHLDVVAFNNRWRDRTLATYGSYDNVQPNVAQTAERSFTETTGAGTYTATVGIPVGAYLLDVQWLNTALWTATTSATLNIGDNDDPDGFFTIIDLKAAPAVGLTISFRDGDTGVGAYSAAAGPMKYYSAAKTLTATVVTVGAAGNAGRSRLVVSWTWQPATAATKV